MTPATTGPMFRPERDRNAALHQQKLPLLHVTPSSPQLISITYLHLEVVEGMLVDVLHLLSQSHGVVGQGRDMGTAFLVVGGVIEAGRRHVS